MIGLYTEDKDRTMTTNQPQNFPNDTNEKAQQEQQLLEWANQHADEQELVAIENAEWSQLAISGLFRGDA
jgi:hypothetical protein